MLRILAGYRNRMVHFYHEISSQELYEICTKDVEDIEEVLKGMLTWINEHPEMIDRTIWCISTAVSGVKLIYLGQQTHWPPSSPSCPLWWKKSIICVYLSKSVSYSKMNGLCISDTLVTLDTSSNVKHGLENFCISGTICRWTQICWLLTPG